MTLGSVTVVFPLYRFGHAFNPVFTKLPASSCFFFFFFLKHRGQFEGSCVGAAGRHSAVGRRLRPLPFVSQVGWLAVSGAPWPIMQMTTAWQRAAWCWQTTVFSARATSRHARAARTTSTST